MLRKHVTAMRFAVAVYGSPFRDQASYSAWQFCRAVLRSRHQLYRVFFYHDGVLGASALSVLPQDEENLAERWQALAAECGVDLAVCIASAGRRGILDEREAKRFQKQAGNLLSGFTISGLGQLADAALSADRLVTFGA